MESQLKEIINYCGSKKEAAKLLGITVRHLDNCLNGNHIGKPLKILAFTIHKQIQTLGARKEA